MKKILNWILILAIACSAIFISPTEVKAEELSVSGIPSEVLVGNTFTVKVKVPSNIGGKLYVSYAKDNLSFKSGSDGVYGGNGLLNANVFFNSAEISVTFEALSVGTVDFSIYMDEAEYSDKDPSEGLPTIPRITKSIKVVNETLSDDNSLSIMYLSQGYISPNFSPSTKTYTTTVDYNVTSVRVTAKTSHAKATIVSVTGNENLQVGENTISVVVKAESGATTTYTIIVTRQEKSADVSEEPDTSENTESKVEGTDSGFDWGGKDLYFTEAVPESSLINDFKQETVLIDNLSIPCFKYAKADLVLLNLKNDVDGGTLFVYNTANQFIYPFVKLEANDVYVIVLQPDETVETPEGYSLCTLSIEGKGTVTAYQYDARTLSEFYLIYCLNNNGQYGWYQYDSVEGTFQRYAGIPLVEAEPSTESNGSGETSYDDELVSDSELAAKLKDAENKTLMMLCIFVFVVAVLLVVIINLILFRRKNNDDELLEEEFEEEYEMESEEASETVEEDDEIEIEFYDMSEKIEEAVKEVHEDSAETTNEKTKQESSGNNSDDDVEFIDLK